MVGVVPGVLVGSVLVGVDGVHFSPLSWMSPVFCLPTLSSVFPEAASRSRPLGLGAYLAGSLRWYTVTLSTGYGVGMSGTSERYLVSGMTCSHCAAAVSEELALLPGVTAVQVDLATSGPSLVTVQSAVPLSRVDVASAVDEAGYDLVGPA